MAGYGDGSIYRHSRNKYLWVSYWVGGKKYRESTGTTDRREAEAYLRHRIAEKKASYEGLVDFVGPQRVMLEKLLDTLEEDGCARNCAHHVAHARMLSSSLP